MNIPELISEKDFFSLSHNDKLIIPSSPYIHLQLRIDVKREGNRIVPVWETVSSRNVEEGDGNYYKSMETHNLYSDNFFDSISLEDNGGMLNCELSLFDRGFSRLERMIMMMIAANKKERKLQKEIEESNSEDEEYYIGFKSTALGINFRLKIGYSDPSENSINNSSEYEQRTEEGEGKRITLSSKWLYFQILDCGFDVSDSGLYSKIKAYSISNSILGKMKLLQRFAILKGTPEHIISSIGKELFLSTGGKVKIMNENGAPYIPGDDNSEDGDDKFKSELGITWKVMSDDEYEAYLSEEIQEDDGNGGVETKQRFTSEQKRYQREELQSNFYHVEVTLGGEPVQERDPETNKKRFDENGNALYQEDYKSITALLREICDKVPPKFYDSIRKEIIEDPEHIKKIIETDDDFIDFGSFEVERKNLRPLNYTYTVSEVKGKDEDDRELKIRFFYKTNDVKQGFIRKYSWRNNLNSLINSFSVSSKLDFAQMNTNIMLGDKVIARSGFENDDVITDNNVSASKEYKIPLGVNEFAIVSGKVLDGYGEGSEDENSRNKAENFIMVNSLREKLRENYFSGNVSIPGDPFFFFDSGITPFKYLIKIEVLNDFNPHEQSYGDKLKESYLSGFYYLKTIKHNLSTSGYTTELNVERFPGMLPSEDVEEVDTEGLNNLLNNDG